MELLPPELLERIYQDNALDAIDLCNVAQTCRRLSETVHKNDKIWQTKLNQLWPDICVHLATVDKNGLDLGDLAREEFFWKALYMRCDATRKLVLQRFNDMDREFHTSLLGQLKQARDEGEWFNLPKIIDNGGTNLESLDMVCLLSILRNIASGEGQKWNHLQAQYYARKALIWLNHKMIAPHIETYGAMPAPQQDIEVAAVYIAQWFQPLESVTVNRIKGELDQLAKSIKENLRIINSDHPLFSSDSPELFDSQSLQESFWSLLHCRQILKAIEANLKNCFNRGGLRNYYRPENSFINKVLENRKGIPILLCLITSCVARRLGLVLEPVNFPRHFILRFREFPSKFGLDQYTFIDPYNGKFSMSFQELSVLQNVEINEAHCERCTSKEFVDQILRNLVTIGKHQQNKTGLGLLRYAVELSILFLPQSFELRVLSIQISLHLRVNINSAIRHIQALKNEQEAMMSELEVECNQLLEALEEECSKPHTTRQVVKRRADFPEVQYAVGMVMRHKKYHYKCVIHGWDVRCQAGEQWIRQMGVDRCERGRNQPFYNVWVMDGSDRYAAEENLIYCSNIKEISHREVGSEFDSFTGRYYVPGHHLAESYPDDLDVAERLVADYFQSVQDSGEMNPELSEEDEDSPVDDLGLAL